MNRRRFLQTTSAGVAIGVSVLHSIPAATVPETGPSTWTEIETGVWRARIGSPEAYTPVSARLIGPNSGGLRALPSVTDPPLSGPAGIVNSRGCLLQLPLEPNENL